MGPFLFFILIAVALITTELVIFNLSVFWFLFVGLGALVAALASWLLPDAGWLFAFVVFVVATAVVSVLLYLPLKKWQNQASPMHGNDAIGQTVKALSSLSESTEGEVTWSGTSWKAKLAAGSEPLKKGDKATITAIDGIILTVKK
ncbi:NfeD family protein [Reinekea marinisedimentorum]|uniref:Membrane protein implicated in regulation of membrane protease activity n=1 Tax=Reinekea marinisedimentorum TaxID=230495 RepID=A0A4R3HUH1_9GAMM|nr:NfeD family protein [Reinekea marinisedimentorum]TCS36133.1 membrane protein implicated in regulation of membrane protease activity [Reinekea marinisedimentorum]